MNEQHVDLNQPLFSKSKPIVVRAVIEGRTTLTEFGPMATETKVENYVCVSALPRELQEKIQLAVQLIINGY